MSYKEVTWPFWILFSILLGLGISLTLIFITKLCMFFFRSIKFFESTSSLTLIVYGTFWIFYLVTGQTVIGCINVLYIQNFLEDGTFKKEVILSLLISLAHLLIGFFITFFCRRILQYYR